MRPARILLLVAGSLFALVGLALAGAGVGLGWATATQRDDDGFFTTSTERFESSTYAITSDTIDLGEPGPDDWWSDHDLATVRIWADSAGTGEVFVGIGPEADVEAFLAGVPHDEVTDVDFQPFSADYRQENVDGTSTPAVPGEQVFWATATSGAATQTLTWDLEPGNWAIVVMNADASAGVQVNISVGGQIDYLVPIAIGLGVGGVLLLLIGTAMIVGGVARSRRRPAIDPDALPSVDTPMVPEAVPETDQHVVPATDPDLVPATDREADLGALGSDEPAEPTR